MNATERRLAYERKAHPPVVVCDNDHRLRVTYNPQLIITGPAWKCARCDRPVWVGPRGKHRHGTNPDPRAEIISA